MSLSDGVRTGSIPTVVLLHGAFSDASIWAGVISRLQVGGIEAVAPANPLRGLAIDARYIAGVVDGIDGPAILVGHSYGGAVITAEGSQLSNVVAAWCTWPRSRSTPERARSTSATVFPTACWPELCVRRCAATRRETPQWSCISSATRSRGCSQAIFQPRCRPWPRPANARSRPRRSKRSRRQRPGRRCPAGTSSRPLTGSSIPTRSVSWPTGLPPIRLTSWGRTPRRPPNPHSSPSTSVRPR